MSKVSSLKTYLDSRLQTLPVYTDSTLKMIIIIIYTLNWIESSNMPHYKIQNQRIGPLPRHHPIFMLYGCMCTCMISFISKSTKDVGKQWKLSRDFFANSGSKLLICKLKRYLAPSHMYKIQIIVANHTCDGWTKIIKPFNETISWRQKILTSGALNISIYEVFAFATGNFHTIVG